MTPNIEMKNQKLILIFWVIIFILLGLAVRGSNVIAQDSQDLAKKLANPVASLISIPLDLDYDRNIGPADDGDRLTLIANRLCHNNVLKT